MGEAARRWRSSGLGQEGLWQWSPLPVEPQWASEPPFQCHNVAVHCKGGSRPEWEKGVHLRKKIHQVHTMVIKNGGLKKDQIFLQISWRATEKRHWEEKTSIVKSKIGEKNWVKHWAYWGKGGELKEGGTEREWSSDWIGPAWRSQKAPKVSFINTQRHLFGVYGFSFELGLNWMPLDAIVNIQMQKIQQGHLLPFTEDFKDIDIFPQLSLFPEHQAWCQASCGGGRWTCGRLVFRRKPLQTLF